MSGQLCPIRCLRLQPPIQITIPAITRAEFEDLKRQVQEMKALLIRAKEYDARNGEPDCEMDD